MWKWEAEGEAKAVIVMVHGAMEHHRRYGWLIEMWRHPAFMSSWVIFRDRDDNKSKPWPY